MNSIDQAQKLPGDRPTLVLANATIISLDERQPETISGDIVIANDRIVSVGERDNRGLPPGVEIIDCRGKIVMPGFVNAHLHTWQTGLRGACSDLPIREYLRQMHEAIGPKFGPGDVSIATFVGALNQINAGTTTLGDWCHNNPTPAHTDAALIALRRSGLRAVFLHGTPKPLPGQGAQHFSKIPHPRSEVERLVRSLKDDTMITLGMAVLGPHFSTTRVAVEDLELAAEFGLIASFHQGGGPAADPDAWQEVERKGLVDERINVVHANDLDDGRLERLVTAGVSFTSTPEVELGMGHGIPIVGRLTALGAMPSLGVDVESVVSGEMIQVARFGLAQQRAHVHALSRAGKGDAKLSSTLDALRWATVGGARALGIEDKTGSLSAGKQADLIVIDAGAMSLSPLHDAPATVMQANSSNIEAVMIGGQWKKRNGRMMVEGLPEALERLARSGDRILAGSR